MQEEAALKQSTFFGIFRRYTCKVYVNDPSAIILLIIEIIHHEFCADIQQTTANISLIIQANAVEGRSSV